MNTNTELKHTSTETVKREDMKPGERYKVEFEGAWRNGMFYVWTGRDPYLLLPDSIPPSATITRLPPKGEPLRVGEVVKYGNRDFDYVVKEVCEDEAWICRELENIICAVANLSRPNGIPITETE